MKRISIVVLISVLWGGSYAQEAVVWGSEVIDVSSEYTPLEYSALQALHQPNVYPAGGENPNAWKPILEAAKSGDLDIIKTMD